MTRETLPVTETPNAEYADPDWQVLLVPSTMVDLRPWVVLQCLRCNCNYWLHPDSAANRISLAQVVQHRRGGHPTTCEMYIQEATE